MWTRWGRVGVDGQTQRVPCGSAQYLASQFNKKVNEKKRKGYNEIEISYETKPKETPVNKSKLKKQKTLRKAESSLPPQVQSLLRFIFDMNLIEKSIVKVGYNVKKLPLGQLSKNTVLKGYEVLKDIEKELKKKSVSSKTLESLSSQFYSFIPHDFNFMHMSNFIINSKEKLKEKLELVQSLSDIQIAAEIINEVDEEEDDTNELDAR